MLSLPAANWWRLFAWLGLGLVIYFFYGRHHSILGKELRGEIIARTASRRPACPTMGINP